MLHRVQELPTSALGVVRLIGKKGGFEYNVSVLEFKLDDRGGVELGESWGFRVVLMLCKGQTFLKELLVLGISKVGVAAGGIGPN